MHIQIPRLFVFVRFVDCKDVNCAVVTRDTHQRRVTVETDAANEIIGSHKIQYEIEVVDLGQ